MENPIRTAGQPKRIRNAEEKGNGVSAFPLLDLPLPILLEILLKLPILAVIQCKSVCRAWYNLISDPNFFTNYAKTPTYAALMISQPHISGADVDEFSLLEISENGGCIRTPIAVNFINYPAEESCGLWMMGSCNGFICFMHFIHSTKIIYLCNLLTGECTAVPQQKLESGEGFLNYKLGFCPFSNKFKVLGFGRKRLPDDRVVEIIDIFTIGTDSSWRRVPSLNVRFGVRRMIALRGAFHWIAREDESFFFIFTFDLEEEKAGGRISVPPGLVEDCRIVSSSYLTVLDNCLCIGDVSAESQLTLWKMNEYGVRESWTKHVIMRNCFPSGLDLGFKHLVAVTTLPNGGIVFALRNRFTLFVYNPKERTSFEIKVPGVHAVPFDVIAYEPMLSQL